MNSNSAPPPTSPAEPSIVTVGLRGCCPRCASPALFDGMIHFAPRCRACGLDYSVFNVGDGPAAFLTLIIGTLVCIGAIVLELSVSPPVWVHIVIWPPITIALVIVSLRVAKGMLLASEYRNRAREGRISDPEDRKDPQP